MIVRCAGKGQGTIGAADKLVNRYLIGIEKCLSGIVHPVAFCGLSD
jgi:hypothetical protein